MASSFLQSIPTGLHNGCPGGSGNLEIETEVESQVRLAVTNYFFESPSKKLVIFRATLTYISLVGTSWARL